VLERAAGAIGGREIHPINMKVGGFHRVPTRRELAVLREPLLRARKDSLALVQWVSRLPILGRALPDLPQSCAIHFLRTNVDRED
jgi:hypothetical protein